MFRKYLLALFFMALSFAGWSQELTPVEVLKLVYQNNPDLQASEALAKSEEEAISSKYSLSSPRLGFMKETDMNFMQMEQGPMKSWSLSQELMFPTKYFSRGRIQKASAKRALHEHKEKQLELRAKALSTYFNCYSAKKILSLLQAQKETLREIARIAETRRAAGTVPQQDEMKAHVEQTKIENEILLMSQEYAEAKYELNSILNRPIETDFIIPNGDFTRSTDIKILEDIEHLTVQYSHGLKSEEFLVEESKLRKGLARMNYLPDFMLIYRQAFGDNVTSSARAFGIEMTIPLWFFTKEDSELSSAVFQELAARRRFESQRISIEAKIKILKSKVQTFSKLLEIYETALIPQATSTLNSSRSAYSAGRVGFQELLDAERTLYSTRIEYYQNFSKFVEAITDLEKTAGTKVSSLPFLAEDI